MKLFLTSIAFFMLSQPALAGQFVIAEPAPIGLLTVVGVDQLPENAAYSTGPHGFESRCYAGSSFLLLTMNNFGEGYEFNNEKPTGARCLKLAGGEAGFENKLGLQLGVERAQVERALFLSLPSSEKTIIYQSTTSINNKTYDVQTWVELSFVNDALSKLSVFTTTTN